MKPDFLPPFSLASLARRGGAERIFAHVHDATPKDEIEMARIPHSREPLLDPSFTLAPTKSNEMWRRRKKEGRKEGSPWPGFEGSAKWPYVNKSRSIYPTPGNTWNDFT